MKKIYIRPEIVTVEMEQMQPVLVGASQKKENVDLDTIVDDNNKTYVKRNYGSVWDDWDE